MSQQQLFSDSFFIQVIAQIAISGFSHTPSASSYSRFSDHSTALAR